MTAVLFGSIGTIADTSELQREAFNEAFQDSGLDWHWAREEYQALLEDSGGAQRIAVYADARGESVDAAAVHARKSEIFQAKLRAASPTPRPGVIETIGTARERGARLALVTTTSSENITALTEALRPALEIGGFDLVLDSSDVEHGKPDPEVYRLALERLGKAPDACVAVEDNAGGVRAAVAAGLSVVAFPGENNAAHAFDGAVKRVDSLTFADLPAVGSAA